MSWENRQIGPRANLRGANLAGQILAGTDLHEADLRGANLTGAILAGSNLRGANLSGADLSGAILSNADLTGAILDGVNFAGAITAGMLHESSDFVAPNSQTSHQSAVWLQGINQSGDVSNNVEISFGAEVREGAPTARVQPVRRTSNRRGEVVTGQELSLFQLIFKSIRCPECRVRQLRDAAHTNTKNLGFSVIYPHIPSYPDWRYDYRCVYCGYKWSQIFSRNWW